MKSKLHLILMMVSIVLLQSANAQKASKKPVVDMVKLMQHRNQVLQKVAAQQRQQASEHGASSQGDRPTGASHGTTGTSSDNINNQKRGTKKDDE